MVIKGAVFDFGGVIMSYGAIKDLFIDLAHQLGVEPKVFFEKRKEVWDLFAEDKRLMCGQISAEEFEEGDFLKAINTVFGKNHTEPLRWLGKLTAPGFIQYNEIMLTFIKTLRENGVKTGLLTNNFFIDKERKLESTPVDRALFDAVVESRLEGIEKPDQKIYELCHSRVVAAAPEIERSEVIFFDDMETNCEAANEFGWRAIHVGKDPKEAILQAIELIRHENDLHLEIET
ncbi:unnamed protein product, partial [Mesorhabditis belari]|uniref:Uncharacterized protein n=1 Tax=Mesorhabditis belari TaxID=2138241 RepID=A0AAF3FD88_9BILA